LNRELIGREAGYQVLPEVSEVDEPQKIGCLNCGNRWISPLQIIFDSRENREKGTTSGKN